MKRAFWIPLVAMFPMQVAVAEEWIGCYFVGGDEVAFIEVVRQGGDYAFRTPGDDSASIPARLEGGRLNAAFVTGGDFESMVLERHGDGHRIVIDGGTLELRRASCN